MTFCSPLISKKFLLLFYLTFQPRLILSTIKFFFQGLHLILVLLDLHILSHFIVPIEPHSICHNSISHFSFFSITHWCSSGICSWTASVLPIYNSTQLYFYKLFGFFSPLCG